MSETKLLDERQNLLAKLKLSEFGFQRAKDQVVLLDRRLRETEIRYSRAVQVNRKSFRYVLRQRLLVIERIRKYYDEYASRKADEIRVVWGLLFGRRNGELMDENRQSEIESSSDFSTDEDES